MKLDMRKIYRFENLDFEAGSVLPSGASVYYECTDCHEVLSSVPQLKVKCECGNLEGGGGNLRIRDAAKVLPMKGTLK